MSNIDDMLAHLYEEVNNKNKVMEERLAETDYDLMSAEGKLVTPYLTHRNVDNQEHAAVNKAFNALKQRAEVSNLTDSFREVVVKETESNTTRSLVQVTQSYARYNSILQAFG